jgi:drug/metabolite transporter (DMT)-like permease
MNTSTDQASPSAPAHSSLAMASDASQTKPSAPPPRARKTQLDVLAVSLLLACCVFWGFNQVLVKATLPEVPPILQAALRFVGATVLLWLWCRWRGIALFERDGSLKAGLVAGGLFAAEFVCIYIGLQHSSATQLTVFLYTAPFWVAGLMPLFIPSERLSPLQWLGLACAFLAVVLALGEYRLSGSSMPTLGSCLALAAGMLWGLTTVVIRTSPLSQISAEKLLFYQVALSALLLSLLSPALGEAWPATWSGFALGSMLIQTVVGAFASYLVWMWLLGRYPATLLSSFVFLTPVFALLFGAWWLGERASLGLLAALFLVTLGIVLVNRKKK